MLLSTSWLPRLDAFLLRTRLHVERIAGNNEYHEETEEQGTRRSEVSVFKNQEVFDDL